MAVEHRELLARLWLALCEGMTGQARASILQRFGSFEAAFQAFPQGYDQLVGPKTQQQLSQLKDAGMPRLNERLKQLKIQTAFLGSSACYPSLLSCITDAPDVLFYQGQLRGQEERAVAMVGSRRETRYGRRQAFAIARDLARQGVTVISGLARGIDTAAHQGALEGGGLTIAVLGSGLARLYPEENQALADKIVQAGGAVITELPPNTQPKPFRFPARNRIVSGLAQALLIIEAREKSGTLITVGHALEQGREVFALPGEVDAPGSLVPHQLIRDGARMCTSAEDLLTDMGWESKVPPAPEQIRMQTASLTGEQSAIFAALEGEALGFDELLNATGLEAGNLNTQLTLMEMEGLICALPGRMFERVRQPH